jgi:hypothetical protein
MILYAAYIAIGLASALIASVAEAGNIRWSGWIYGLIGFVAGMIGWYRGTRRERLESAFIAG